MTVKFDNNLRGVLFKKAKEKDSQPDYSGECEIAGVEYWISSWINKSKDQRMFLSLKFKAKDRVADGVKNSPPKRQDDFNDEIPF